MSGLLGAPDKFPDYHSIEAHSGYGCKDSDEVDGKVQFAEASGPQMAGYHSDRHNSDEHSENAIQQQP
jgi:hypothetical protein